MRVAISQSNYIPWKGYFDLINSVDIFVLYDDVQYTHRDWRNRNKVKMSDGTHWLSIPIKKNHPVQSVRDAQVLNTAWQRKHWNSICHAYANANYFEHYRSVFEALYTGELPTSLSAINRLFIVTINEILGIQTTLRSSNEFTLEDGRNERLLGICKQLGATDYISGPAAQDYMDESLFQQEGVNVEWMDYAGYPQYRQVFEPFEHAVSVLDLLFNEGSDAIQYMKSFPKKS